jgi:hypothetical protein
MAETDPGHGAFTHVNRTYILFLLLINMKWILYYSMHLTAVILTGAIFCFGQEGAGEKPVPTVLPTYGAIPGKFSEYKVILEPDRNEAEWWAGAPSVVRDRNGVFWMACRMRTADAPLGMRGYEIRILRSQDGIDFRRVHALRREDVPIPGFERPSLLIDPHSGLFKLYGCGPWKGGPWSIIKFDDAAEPTRFRASTAKLVIRPRQKSGPRDMPVEGYKDPVILCAKGAYHAYVIGQLRGLERTYHFRSRDGESWEAVGNPYESMMELSGWHDFFVRPASVLPLGFGYLFVYEGSNVKWHDPVYNVTTGLGFTFDLDHVIDLTPESPLVVSTTPSALFSTWRYSCWMHVDDEIWVYAEVARPNLSNEIRLFRLRR